MNEPYISYLSLLNEMISAFESLTVLTQEMAAAVRRDDLTAVEQVMKREQAMFLTLRGLEQQQATQLSQLGLTGVPLSQLHTSYPQNLQLQAKETAENLKRQFTIYQGAAHVTRDTLECNLYEIDRVLANLDVESGGIGYTTAASELPSTLKTDFRA